MINRSKRLAGGVWILAVTLVCAPVAPSRGASVKKADDATVSGPLVALEKGAVVLNVDAGGKPQRTSVSLEDVVEITIDPASDVPPPPPDPAAPSLSASEGKGPEYVSLFDGKTLNNWEGEQDVWSVRDGVLTGAVTEETKTAKVTFITYTGGEFADFELHYKFRITGGRPNSSGLQFRSHLWEHDGLKDVNGYQQDLGMPAGLCGGIVDSGTNANGQPVKSAVGERVVYNAEGERQSSPLGKSADELNALLKTTDWNDAVLIAKGNRMVSMINGEVFADVTNDSPNASTEGLFAFQISRRTVMTVELKDLRVRKLTDSDAPRVRGLAWDRVKAEVDAARVNTAAAQPDVTRLFDGKTLGDWAGDTKFWSVRDGAMTGVVRNGDAEAGSTYLYWQGGQGGELADFDLRFRYKITGGYSGSSGLFYRGKVLDAGAFRVNGYQFNLGDEPEQSGTLWDGSREGGNPVLLAGIGEKVIVKNGGAREVGALAKNSVELLAGIKRGDWNEARLNVQGNHFIQTINGNVVADVIDEGAAAQIKAGVIAFQLDRRQSVTVQFKDLELRRGDAATNVRWVVRLTNGDQLSGTLDAWNDQGIQLKTDSGVLVVPVKQVREIWHATDDEISKARAAAQSDKPAGRATEDVAFARKDEQIVPVGGLALGADVGGTGAGAGGGSLKFRFRDQERKIVFEKLVGVVLAVAEDAAVDDSLQQSLALKSGDVISGKWTKLDAGTITLDTPWGAALNVPVKDVERVRTKNGRLVFVSDLAPAQVEQVPYFDRLIPYRVDKSSVGGPIKLSTGEHAKGLSVHSHTILRYDIGRRFEKFRTKLGFQQPEGKIGRAKVRVLGDDKVLHEIADARGDQPPVDLDLPVAGVSRLTLEVDFGPDQDVGDRVVWADARLLRAAASK